MSNNSFYIIAAQMLRQGKDCKFLPIRKCLPVENDKECQVCITDKKKLVRAVK